MPTELDQAVVVITGAASGVGRAAARRFRQEGASVVITSRRGPALEELATELVPEALAVPGDVTDSGHLDRVAARAVERFGRIDVWVNNAGGDILTGTAASMPHLAKLDMLLAVDLRGTMLASWQAAEIMAAQPEGGVIINMSWDHVITGMAGENQQLYSAVKGGVMAFSKALARSLAPRIRVNILAPGWIETAFGAGANDKLRRAVAESTPLKRWGTPEDVAGAAVYLASPAASFLTGQTINIGGGIVM
jgi:3-oxoacyl-[acyl-carrier protein] reductase